MSVHHFNMSVMPLVEVSSRILLTASDIRSLMVVSQCCRTADLLHACANNRRLCECTLLSGNVNSVGLPRLVAC